MHLETGSVNFQLLIKWNMKHVTFVCLRFDLIACLFIYVSMATTSNLYDILHLVIIQMLGHILK